MSRVAVVTGANQGIGYFIAKQLRSSGEFGTIILACRRADAGSQAAAELGCVAEQLDLNSDDAIDAFAEVVRTKYGRLDVICNNAAFAFTGADPTPHAEQAKPTLRPNFWGTVRLTEILLPLLRTAEAPAVVNVASGSGVQAKNGMRNDLAEQFVALRDKEHLYKLVRKYEEDTGRGEHTANGWCNSNYGFSKCALMAYTFMLAKQEPGIRVNCCCPGYCDTSMTSHKGPRPPEQGALNASMLALRSWDKSGTFVQNQALSSW